MWVLCITLSHAFYILAELAACSDHILCCPAVHSAFLLLSLLSSGCHVLVLWWVADSHATPWDSPGKNTGVGCYALPGDLPNLEIEPWFPALQVDPYCLSPQGSPCHIQQSLPYWMINSLKAGIGPIFVFHCCVSCCRVRVEICHVTERNSTMCDLKLLC